MKIAVIGLGYIGLPTALIMAANGVKVVGIDYNEELVNTLNEGKTTFEEKDLDKLLSDAIVAGIRFSHIYESADVYIVAVPTPYVEETKQINPEHVISAVEGILKVCGTGAVIAIESTISPGTVEKYIRPIIKNSRFEVHLAHVPERILPGNMIYELSHNSRTIGADDRVTAEKVKDVYAAFCKAEIVITDIKTAEMTKVIENTYRDINIAFANELARICHKTGMNVYEVIRIANMHPRVNILSPGPGVGGHCISVDPWFLVGDYPELTSLILTARNTNDLMPEYVSMRIREIAEKHGVKEESQIGLYGLTYKEEVDDVRESPTLRLIQNLKKNGTVGVKVYDPFIKIKIVDNQYTEFDAFLCAVKIVVIMVGHKHIKKNIEKLQDKILYDTRNCIDKDAFKGSIYHL